MGGMTGSLLLLLWAGVSVSTMVDLQKRIINGQNCKDKERQYHVKLHIKKQTGTGFCGGSLISDQWILTAAHCWNVTHGRKIYAFLRVHPGKNPEKIVVDEIKIFKDKDNNGNVRTHDIMLLRLTTPRPGFKQIKLPYCVHHPTPKKGTKVQIAGYAAITAFPNGTRNPTVVDHLKCANIKVEDCPVVRDRYEHVFCGKTDDSKKPVDVCKGDSGGGVVYKNRLHGVIVRSGIAACSSSAEFMDVCGYMDWITRITAIKPPKSVGDKVRNAFKSG